MTPQQTVKEIEGAARKDWADLEYHAFIDVFPIIKKSIARVLRSMDLKDTNGGNDYYDGYDDANKDWRGTIASLAEAIEKGE